SCSGCLAHAFDTGQTCQTASTNCQMDPGCSMIQSCVSGCAGDAACDKACILPFDKDMSHTLFEKKMTCGCGACEDACTASKPIDCSAGAAGAGGTGGSTTGSGGADSGMPPPNCACIVSWNVTDCQTCGDQVDASGQACNALHNSCL